MKKMLRTFLGMGLFVGFLSAGSIAVGVTGGCGGTTSSGGDTTAPTVSLISPTNGETDVIADTTVAITFSEAMDPATLTTSNIGLSAGGSAVTSELSISSDDKTVTLTPSAALDPVIEYTATVATGVKDAAGNALASASVNSFTTRCASTDDFTNSATLDACYGFYQFAIGTPLDQETIAGTLLASLTLGDSLLTYQNNNQSASAQTTGAPYLAKILADGNFSVVLQVSSLTQLTVGDDSVLLAVVNSDATAGTVLNIVNDAGGSLAVGAASFSNSGGAFWSVSTTPISSLPISGTLPTYIRLTRTGTVYTYQYRFASQTDADYVTIWTNDRSIEAGNDCATDDLCTTTTPLYIGISDETSSLDAHMGATFNGFVFQSGGAVDQD
jgi:hypothetical protein